jgi:hypothetical protein
MLNPLLSSSVKFFCSASQTSKYLHSLSEFEGYFDIKTVGEGILEMLQMPHIQDKNLAFLNFHKALLM